MYILSASFWFALLVFKSNIQSSDNQQPSTSVIRSVMGTTSVTVEDESKQNVVLFTLSLLGKVNPKYSHE